MALSVEQGQLIHLQPAAVWRPYATWSSTVHLKSATQIMPIAFEAMGTIKVTFLQLSSTFQWPIFGSPLQNNKQAFFFYAIKGDVDFYNMYFYFVSAYFKDAKAPVMFRIQV